MGLKELTSLLPFSGVVIWKFVLPALLTGAPGLAVGLCGSALIMFVVLYTTHGFSVRTSAALAGKASSTEPRAQTAREYRDFMVAGCAGGVEKSRRAK